MASDIVTIIETVAVTQFLTPTAKNLGEAFLERGKQLTSKAAAYLAAVGRSPQSVEEKLLVPIALGAGLETDPTLAEKWAALLANAADPAQRVAVLPSFSAVLNDLSTDDAEVLSFIYDWGKPEDDGSISQSSRLVYSVVYTHFDWQKERVELSIDNLLRLRLCAELAGGFDSFSSPDPDGLVALTRFGVQFLQAVTPPTL